MKPGLTNKSKNILMKKAFHYFVIIFILLSAFCSSAESKEIPEPSIILDLADVLNKARENGIKKAIEFHESKTGNEIAILTVESLEGEILEDYSLRVARTWGVGKKDQDNGVLILVAMQERKIRIEVGYGLEQMLSDDLAGSIIYYHMTYWFKRGEYGRGIMEGANTVIKALEGRYKGPSPKRKGESRDKSISDYLLFGAFVLFWCFPYLLNMTRTLYPTFMSARGWDEKGGGFFGDNGFIGFIGLGGGGESGSSGFGSGGGFSGGGFGGGGASGGW